MAKELARTRLKVRVGYLLRSIQATLQPDGLTVSLRAGGGDREVRYARYQEKGGTIRPVKGKFLAIPMAGGPAATPSGVAKFASARDAGPLRFVPILGGAKGLLVRDIAGRGKAGRGARSEIVYTLVRSVTGKPKWYLRDAMAEASGRLSGRLDAALHRALGGDRGQS